MSTWDKETDVVVVGFGGQGAERPLRRTMPVPRRSYWRSSPGNIILSALIRQCQAASSWWLPDADSACTYFERCGQGLADKEMYRVWAEEAVKATEWLKELAPGLKFGTEQSPSEHQNFPGAESVFRLSVRGKGIALFQGFDGSSRKQGDRSYL